MRKQQVTILGSTGSVGANTLEVIALHPERFEVFALSANTQVEIMLAQAARFQPRFAVMASAPHAQLLQEKLAAESLPTRVLHSAQALDEIAAHESVDIVMAAIVGAAGLSPCLAAAKAGKRLLLANKEALVVGGSLFIDAVQAGGARLLPIDSEHSAIYQSLPDDPTTWGEQVQKIILTASGGPFRALDPAQLRRVTPEQACAHPNWVMGRKISVDSATMMNKALEVIEARYLFGLGPERLEVVIHPQSIIHSMVQYHDSSVVAQLGTADMRVPIAYGLSWPQRMESGAKPLDFARLSGLTFEACDSADHRARFPGLALAWEVLAAAPSASVTLNAANEIAVASFLERRIRFDQIHQVNLATLDALPQSKPAGLEDLLALDQLSRTAAHSVVNRLKRA